MTNIKSKKGVFLFVVVVLSLLIPLAATSTTYSVAKDEVESKNRQRFESRTNNQEQLIQERIRQYVGVLKGASGLFIASDVVTRDEFRNYAMAVDSKNSIPGALGLGFIADVPTSQIDNYVDQQNKSGNEGFEIKPDLSYENGYYIITYVEPFEVNDLAIGLNIAFENNRREAAIASKESGEPRITKSVQLVQGGQGEAGFLIFFPIYAANVPLDTQDQRLSAFKGWVYSPMIAKDFFEALTVNEGLSSLDVQVYEKTENNNDVEIFNDLSKPAQESKYVDERKISFLGQIWNVKQVSSPEFESQMDYSQANTLLFGGLFLSFISLMLGLVIFRRSSYVEKEVESKTLKLLESDERFERVVVGANTGIWDWFDVTQDHIYWSPQFYSLLGYEDREVESSGKFFTEQVIHPEDLSGSIEAFENAVRNGNRYETEYRLKTKSGMYRWFLANGFISNDPETNVQRISGSISDITDLHNAREDLETSKERLSLAVEGSQIGLFDLDDVGKDEGFLSEQTYKLLGYEAEELEAKASSLVSLVHPDEREFAVSQVVQAIKNISNFVFECQIRKKEGSYIWIEAKGAVTVNPQTGKKRTTGSFIDISERKEIEKLKNEFVSTVSHELRTPLTSIRGSLGLLSGTMLDELPDEAKNLLEIANRNSERLGVLIDDILDMEKLTSGKLEFFIDAIGIGGLVNRCVGSIEAYAQIHNIKIRMQSIDENLKVDADPERLSQVLSNILSNAIKFSGDGEVIEVYVRKSEDSLRICVEDNGSGVPEEFRSKIFGQFSQSDSSSTRSQGGSGLGLYISQKFMERMKGKIGFDPKESGGTIFWLEFKISEGMEHKRVRVDNTNEESIS